MKRNSIDRVLNWAVIALFLLAIAYAGVSASSKQKMEETVEDHIRHADTYYWFSMAHRGKMKELKYGVKELDIAEKLLDESDYDLTTKQRLLKEINASRVDLKQQIIRTYDTFHGVFPYGPYMVRESLFRDSRSTGIFEILDDPHVIATRGAVDDLIKKVIETQTVVAQYDVVFVSDPPDRELENEALYLFNRSPRFFVHNFLEVAKALDPEEQNKLRELEPTTEVLAKLRESFGHRNILVCRARKLDEVNYHHFYVAEGRLFSGVDSDPAVVLNNYGFCEDRTHMLFPILLFNALMFVGAILLYRVLAEWTSHSGERVTWKHALTTGGVGFLWGRILVWGLSEVGEHLEPHSETLIWFSFWWPSVTAIILLIGPGIVLRFAENRFAWLGSSFSTFNRMGAIFAVITLGSTTYLAQCAMYLLGWSAWSMIPPLLVGAVLAALVVGRALDDTDPVPFERGIAAALMTLMIGPAFSCSYPQLLWIVLLPIAAVAVAGFREAKQSGSKQAAESDESGQTPDVPTEAAPTTVAELIKLAYAPPFHETVPFKELLGHLDPWFEGNTVALGVIGAAGIGKSATLRAVEERCRARIPNVAILRGTCQEPQSGATAEPYQPFAEAIADHFAVNLLAPQANQMAGIDDALGGMFDSVVPFSDILFPPSGQGASGSKKELLTAIAAMFRKLVGQQPVLLIIDDVHWMDPASKELAEFLLREFPAGAHHPFAILLASRETSSPASHAELVMLDALTQDDLRSILVNGLGMQPSTADELLDAIGHHDENLHWLFQIVIQLSQKELFAWKDGGFTLADPDIKISDHIPDDFRQSLKTMVDENPRYRRVLGCAACIGPEFTIEVLSHAIDMPRLELIQLLDEIEENTGLVADLRQKDDTFAFRSAFMLEVLRQILEVSVEGPNSPSPQRIREFHSRLADAWEQTVADANVVVYRLANHHYAAGARHAEKALRAIVSAADTASNQFQHDLARRYVAMAKECSALAQSSEIDLDRELLMIECHAAHVEGKNRVKMAQRASDFLDERPDADIEVFIATAQAWYDAGIDTRDQQYFVDCVKVAERIVEKFDDALAKAEGHHFWGIGLPVAQRDERRKHLETAVELVDSYEPKSTEALSLEARLANSLAEQLSYGGDEDRARARELYEMSIGLKNREDIRDVEGLAFAHGGLGRLAFFAKEPEFELARTHFAEDLKYSEKIGSVTGQTKMHSMLGACDLGQSDSNGQAGYTSAYDHYRAALDLAVERVDVIFSLAGLIEACAGLDKDGELNQSGESLVEVIQSAFDSMSKEDQEENPVWAIPRICLPNVQSAIRNSESAANQEWHRWIVELTDNNTVVSKESSRTNFRI